MTFYTALRGYKSLRNCAGLLCVLCASVVNGFSLDREAFTFTNYDLNLQIEPEQHRLGVRGKITLRNDSPTSQKTAVLQISSSLSWRSIKSGDKSLQFVTQPYASDIDHTGALSEAIVTLPQEIAPHGTIELEIAYEGVVLLDATRLTRIGTPEDVAQSSDWDQISPGFTGLRGVGYVGWYPIATEVANFSEGESMFAVLGRWKAREARSIMRLEIDLPWMSEVEMQLPSSPAEPPWPPAPVAGPIDILLSGVVCVPAKVQRYPGPHRLFNECTSQRVRLDAPTLVIADYQVLEKPGVEVRFLKGHEVAAANFADAAEKIAPFISDWFGPLRERAKVADLPDPNAAPFESGALLLTPLAYPDANLAGLAAAHQLTHAAFLSFRPWIEEGLAHFAQALYLEHEKNRQAALDYMGLHRAAFLEAEKRAALPPSEGPPRSDSPPAPDDEARQSLVSTTSEELYRSKAMSVWWMLRDMIGDEALKKAIAAYRPEEDKEPSYMARLISAQTKRDLEWFFDDWVYRDRGLPDFKVESVSSRQTMTGTYMVAITIENLGGAGAEVPVIVKSSGADAVRRLEVRAKSKATIRVESPAAPTEVVVNDGSVPESDITNNVFKIESETKSSLHP